MLCNILLWKWCDSIGKHTNKTSFSRYFLLKNQGLVCRKIGDERLLLTIVPSKINYVTIHRRMMIKYDLIDPMIVTNIFLIYTFIVDGGKDYIVYREKQFTIGSITGFVIISSFKTCQFFVVVMW